MNNLMSTHFIESVNCFEFQYAQEVEYNTKKDENRNGDRECYRKLLSGNEKRLAEDNKKIFTCGLLIRSVFLLIIVFLIWSYSILALL